MTPTRTARHPPKALTKASAEVWRRLVGKYAIDDEAGLLILEEACRANDRALAAQALVEKHGELVKDRFGQLRTNPAVAIVRDSSAAYLRAIRQLNLDIEPPKPPRIRGAL